MDKFGRSLLLGLVIMFSPDIVLGGNNRTRTTTLIAVRDMAHAPRNLALRNNDGDAKTKAAQQVALQASITRGKGWGAFDVEDFKRADDGAPNWLSNSIFEVELREESGKYEVLAGSHRLEALENAAKENKAWLEFEVPCYVVTCSNDAERDAIIIKNNNDGPEAGTVIKMSPVTRFATAYAMMPRCDYICTLTQKGDEVKASFVSGTPQGWSSDEYQRETGIGGSSHVPFSALTRLGKHFEIPVEMFNANRLRVKSQITAALLTKTTKKGEGSSVVSEYGKGFEIRYKEARAGAKRSMDAETIKEQFKGEFLDILNIGADTEGNIMPDAEGHDGSTALGQTAPLTEEEKKTKKAQDEASSKEQTQQAQRAIANAQPYAFARYAVANAFGLPDAPTIDANIGNALDLLFSVNADAFKVGTIALAEYKRNPTNAKAATVAAAAIVAALESLPGVSDVEIETIAQAASGKPNTPKKAKGKGNKH